MFLLKCQRVMKKSSLFCITLGLLLGYSVAMGQASRHQLELRKRKNLARIVEVERILKQTQQQQDASLGQLTAIDQQIKGIERLVSTLSDELRYVKTEITGVQRVVLSLETDLSGLREEYARMITWAYQNRVGVNQLVFLFSADNFKQFYLRMKYLARYAEQRRIQLEEIQKVQQALQGQETTLNSKQNSQERLVTMQQARKKGLIQLKGQKKKIIAKLTKQSKRLRGDLLANRKALNRLNGLINGLLAKEKTKRSSDPLTDQAITVSFQSNKKRLMWPVKGIIAEKFGKHTHPVLKRIEVNSPGVEIQTIQNAPVQAVFDGMVSVVSVIPGMDNVIILKHGSYYTVYGRLARVGVTVGEVINRGQSIGVVATSPKGVSRLHFQVWEGNKKFNPEAWLSARRQAAYRRVAKP